MIMCTLLSMVYGLLKRCWLTHATCTCFKETPLLFNVQLSCLVNFILCSADKNMFKINNEKMRFCCMCSELRLKTWHGFGVSVVEFDQSQNINIVSLLLTVNNYLSVGCESTKSDNCPENTKSDICFVIKVARPISLELVLIHYTRSNNSRPNDARFMHKLYLSLHAINRLTGAYNPHRVEKF